MNTDTQAATSDIIRDFYERRHPGYNESAAHWHFLEATYRGGREWFRGNVFRYFKEGEQEYTDRLNRAYRFNHTKEVVELVQKYLFKGDITRNKDDAPDVITEFWENATKGGSSISQLMRLVSVMNSVSGRCALVVDNNYKPITHVSPEGPDETSGPVMSGEIDVVPDRSLSVAEARDQNMRIYAYTVPIRDILDYAYDEDGDGQLLWVKLREFYRDDRDPFNSTGEIIERVRLWTRNGWELYEEFTTGEEVIKNGVKEPIKGVRQIAYGEHGLGFVPVYFADHTISEDPYRVNGLIDDIAYLDRAIANYLSNLDAIIQDQTFSQLAIPSQSLAPGDDAYQKVLEMGTKRIFVFDAGAGSSAKPEYLSPDPKQANVILMVVNKIINEIYNTVGLAGERTKEDNAVGIDNSSGVAKAYDFERVNSLLMAKAQSCQNAENWLVKTVLAWAGGKQPETDLVTYPTSFDVTGLSDELITAETLARFEAPNEVRREQMRNLISKIFPQLKKDLRVKMLADIETWLDAPDPTNATSSIATSSANSVATRSRQGEVTANTDKAPQG